MSDVFADTYYFVALLNHEGEEERQRAEQATLQRSGRMVTTVWVLLELANTLCDPRHRQLFLDTLAALQDDPDCLIVGEEASLFDQGVARYRDRRDKEWSLTDCISFLVMEKEQITEALTADHHFEQAGFIALLKPTT